MRGARKAIRLILLCICLTGNGMHTAALPAAMQMHVVTGKQQ